MTERDEDLDRWIAGLQGRARPDAGPKTSETRDLDAETAALREAVLRAARVEDEGRPDAASSLEHRWQRLAFRLRREGAFRRPNSLLTGAWVPAAMAAALMVAVMANIVLDRPPGLDFPVDGGDPPQLRGELQIMRVQAPRPVQSAQRLAAAVKPLGAAPKVYASGAQATVDMDVNADELIGMQEELRNHGIFADRLVPGLLRVIFTQAGQFK